MVAAAPSAASWCAPRRLFGAGKKNEAVAEGVQATYVALGVGMLSVAFVFQYLAHRKPHLDSGGYSYARAGLGDFIGFTAGWGYWIGSVIAHSGPRC